MILGNARFAKLKTERTSVSLSANFEAQKTFQVSGRGLGRARGRKSIVGQIWGYFIFWIPEGRVEA